MVAIMNWRFWATRADLGEMRERLDRLDSAVSDVQHVTNTVVTPGDIRTLETDLNRLESLQGEFQDATNARLEGQGKRLADLVVAIAEGIERTDRAERRVRSVVQRARKELAKLGYEDPGLEAEAQELRLVDGDGGEEDGVRPVPASVETGSEASSVRGVPLDVLRRARGFRG